MGNKICTGKSKASKYKIKAPQPTQPAQAANETIEEDIIIKCDLKEMKRQFFYDYEIVWHDPNIDLRYNKAYRAQLEKFCEVRAFTEWEKAADHIKDTKKLCTVITSGLNGELLVKDINSRKNVERIFIFCANKDYHSIWAKNYPQISGIEVEIKEIFSQIEQNLPEWEKSKLSFKTTLPAFAPIFNDWDKSEMNNLHRYLKVIPNFKDRSQAKADFVRLSKAIYLDEEPKNEEPKNEKPKNEKPKNEKLQRFAPTIKKFEQKDNEYNKNDVLNWYTKESFFYPTTNNCLRIATSDSIQYCRLPLKDLEQAIKEQYKEKSKDFSGLLYRGAYLSEEEWSSLKANLGREIEMHGFLSVSKDKKVALNFLTDFSKMVWITVLVPKCPNEAEQGFAEVEEVSEHPHEKEILFNVRSRFTVLETEDMYSQSERYRHLVLLYGAQESRKYLTEKNPVLEVQIPDVENISCSLCKIFTSQSQMFFKSLVNQDYFCQKCIPKRSPLLCIPVKKTPKKEIKIKGMLMTYPENFTAPMSGYKCQKCNEVKKLMYYQCTECSSEGKKVWCEDCLDGVSLCIEAGHVIILESTPFSFWCERISQKELDHLKHQDTIMAWDETFQQAEMFLRSNEHRRSIEFCRIYIERNGKSKKDMNLAGAYFKMADGYRNQAEYKKALGYYEEALKIIESWNANHTAEARVCYANMAAVYLAQAEYVKALEFYSKVHSQILDIHKYSPGNNRSQLAISFSNMGTVYSHQGKYKEALVSYEDALKIHQAIYGENDPEVASSYHQMAIVKNRQGEFEKSIEYSSKAIEIQKGFYGENHPSVANSYINLGNVHNTQGKYDQALEDYNKALIIFKSLYKDSHPEIATCYNNLAMVYQSQAEYKKALHYFSKALEIQKLFYGDRHPSIATSSNNMGVVYLQQGDSKKANELCLQALEMRKSFYGENHPEIANSYNNMGLISRSQGQNEKALEYHSKALDIRSNSGENHPEVGTSYYNMGEVYESRGRYDEAYEFTKKALDIFQKLYREDHPEIATSLCNLAVISLKQSKLQDPIKFKEMMNHGMKAEENFKAFYGENHPQVAACLNKFALGWDFVGEDRHAFTNYDKALKILQKYHGENHCSTAAAYSNLGQVYLDQRNYQKALEHYEKALAIEQLLFGDSHPVIATSYNLLGMYWNTQREYKKALEYHEKALEIQKSFSEENHPQISTAYQGIGAIYKDQGENNTALEYYHKALKIDKTIYGDNTAKVAVTYNNIGLAFNSQGKYNKAIEYYHKALEIYKIVYGSNNLKFAIGYNNLAVAYNSQAEYIEALEFFGKSLTIFQLFPQKTHPEIAQVCSSIGRTHAFLGDQNTALKYHLEALEMKKQDDADKAWIYCNIGDVFNNIGQHSEALNSFSKSLDIQKSLLPKNHYDIADSYSGFGRVYLSLKEHEKALEYHLKSLEIRKSVFDENHPNVATSYFEIADVFKSKGEDKEALENYSKSLKIRKQIFGEDHIFVKAVSDQIQALTRAEGTEEKTI